MNPQEQHEYDDAVQHGHTLFIDNYPIDSQHVIDIYNAVKKKRPDLVVAGVSRGVRANSRNEVSGMYIVYRGLDMAYANLPEQVVGSIGYEYDQFFVTSRLIENAKYSQWSGRDHNTKKSKHMNNIVKEAVKALLPTQFHEVIAESDGKFSQNIRGIRDKAIQNMRGMLTSTYAALRDELFHMVATGYVPKNKSFADAMAYVVASKDEYERNESYNPPATFIWIKPDCVVYGESEEKAQSIPTMEELPEEIRGKLFVLMVVDKGAFIDDVGMKADDNKFWVIL
jgi:hypothetical protein